MHHDYFYDIFESISDGLTEDKRCPIYYSYDITNKDLKKYLTQKVPKSRIIANDISPFLPFSMFITAEVTGPDFPVRGMPTTTVEIYHGTGIANLVEKAELLSRFDVHLLIGEPLVNLIQQFVIPKNRATRFYKIGYPKTDLILSKNYPPAEIKALYHLTERKTILYAPHWNEDGSLHTFGTEIIEKMLETGMTLLLKVHNYLFTKFKKDNWQEQFEQLQQKYPNLIVVKRPNTQELFPLADIMVTDTGTTAPMEYSLTEKPIVIFKNEAWFDKNPHYNEIERELVNIGLHFTDINSLTDILHAIENNDDTMKDRLHIQRIEQQKLVEKYLFNPGRATKQAITVLKKELS